MDLRDSVLLRAPVLGAGLGFVAGGLESAGLAASMRLHLEPGEAAALFLVAVAVGGLLGAGAGLVGGLAGRLVDRGDPWRRPAAHATSMAVAAALLAGFYLVPSALLKWNQGLVPAALAIAATPAGVAGFVWFNAHYWLRREAVGEEYRLGWRGWSLVAGAGIALVSAAIAASRDYGSPRAIETDPAVVLVTVDTLRRDHVSAFAGEAARARTPRIDALVARGVRFDDAVTPMPETAPAHAALLTGLHPVRSGVLSNGHALAPGYRTLAEVLRDEGYATGAFVSAFAVAARTGLDQGFEVYDDDFLPWMRGLGRLRAVRVAATAIMRFGRPGDFPFLLERPAADTVARALDWVEENADRPFFLWVHLFEPHSPYEPHRDGMPDVDHRWILEHEDRVDYDEALSADLRRLYAGEVEYVDGQVGRLLDGIEERTDRPLLVVFAADHGEMLGEHGIMFNHHGIFDEAVRVPLAISGPGLPAGAVVSGQVRLVDVPATILGVLGVEVPKGMEGGDLRRFLEGRAGGHGWGTLIMGRRTASLAGGLLLGYRAPRADGSGDAKLVLDVDSGKAALYDLAEDPGEERDISAEQAAATDALLARVRAEAGDLLRAGGVSGGAVDAATREALEALGYVE